MNINEQIDKMNNLVELHLLFDAIPFILAMIHIL